MPARPPVKEDPYFVGDERPPRRRSFFGLQMSPWKPTLIELIVILMIISVLVMLMLPSVNSHSYDALHRFPPSPPEAGRDHADLAGAYYARGYRTRGMEIVVLPDGRYSLAGIVGHENGYLTRDGAKVILTPAETDKQPLLIDRELYVVRWRSAIYLLPEQKLGAFVQAIVKGDEPAGGDAGRYYLRQSGNLASGLPELPEPWATKLRDRLILGTIRGVRADGGIMIDVGTADGIREGMNLTIRNTGRTDDRALQVVSTADHSCVAVELEARGTDRAIRAGWEVVAERRAQ